jgi:outer membrane protein W
MKRKLLSIMAVVGMMTVANAQRPVDANPFSLEGGLNLTGGNTFSAPSLRLRYFATDNIAGRLSFSMNNTTDVDNIYGFNDDGIELESLLGTVTTKSSATWVGIGGSYHFSQLDRLSPYAALDIMIGSGSTTSTGDKTNGFGYDAATSFNSTSSWSGFGVNIAAGFDYYFAENVFVGAELGFMSMSYTDKGGETSFTSGGTTVTSKNFPSGNFSSFGNAATGSIRLGWRF